MKKNIFQNIIGYKSTKKTLERLIDVLNNKEKYLKIGSTIPHGLLLYGPPGLGKTTFSKEILKLVNRKSYIIRKIKSDGDFIDYMNKIFDEAKRNQPSIILLDDIDKFSEDDNHSNQEEFVAVQSFIDDIKCEDIFIIATANKRSLLPDSLLRSGRFDLQIEIDYPDEDESKELIQFYLKDKKIDDDVNIENISYILSSISCADFEKVCNQAGIYAAYKNKDKIGNDELLRASLELTYATNIEEYEKEDPYTLNVAYHEAGHALIGEYLEPGSVTFVSVIKTSSSKRGFTNYHNNDHYFEDIQFMKNRLITLLGGRAATEIVYHTCDTGANSDLHRAYGLASRFVDNYCMFDFHSWIQDSREQSEVVKQSKDDHVNQLVQEYYDKAKEILLLNKDLLDKLAHQLKNKKILFSGEIHEILKDIHKL